VGGLVARESGGRGGCVCEVEGKGEGGRWMWISVR